MPAILTSEMLSPFVISAPTLTLTPATATTNTRLSFLPLENPFKTAMLLDEMRFFVSVAGANANRTALDAARVTVRCGRQLLTTQDIPLAVLCKGHDSNTEGVSSVGLNNAVDVGFIWRFDRAMYLPKGGQIEVDFALIGSDLGLLTAGPYTANVAVAGRSLPEDYPVPDRIVLPYAAKWLTAVTTGPSAGAGAVQLLATSSASDLRNIHQRPLYVTRFTGLLEGQNTEGAVPDFVGNARDAQIMLYKHDGELGLRDGAPPAAPLSPPTRSWSMKNSILQPNGYYIADINYTPAEASLIQTRLLLAMVGYHEIDVTELGVSL